MTALDATAVRRAQRLKAFVAGAFFVATLVLPAIATATETTKGAATRQTISQRAKIAYHTRAVPALVDINAHAGETFARGATPQSALTGAVANHVADRLVERFTKDRASAKPAVRSPTAPVTALAAARASAFHASTIVPKSATIRPHTSPRGRPDLPARARSHLPRR